MRILGLFVLFFIFLFAFKINRYIMVLYLRQTHTETKSLENLNIVYNKKSKIFLKNLLTFQ